MHCQKDLTGNLLLCEHHNQLKCYRSAIPNLFVTGQGSPTLPKTKGSTSFRKQHFISTLAMMIGIGDLPKLNICRHRIICHLLEALWLVNSSNSLCEVITKITSLALEDSILNKVKEHLWILLLVVTKFRGWGLSLFQGHWASAIPSHFHGHDVMECCHLPIKIVSTYSHLQLLGWQEPGRGWELAPLCGARVSNLRYQLSSWQVQGLNRWAQWAVP